MWAYIMFHLHFYFDMCGLEILFFTSWRFFSWHLLNQWEIMSTWLPLKEILAHIFIFISQIKEGMKWLIISITWTAQMVEQKAITLNVKGSIPLCERILFLKGLLQMDPTHRWNFSQTFFEKIKTKK